MHLKISKVTTQNHSLFFEVAYPIASITSHYTTSNSDYFIRARFAVAGRFLYTLNYFNLTGFTLDPNDMSYIDFTCENKEDITNTSFFNQRQNNYPIENTKTIYTVGFQLPNTLPEGIMNPSFIDQTDRRAIGAYIKIEINGYKLVPGGLYYSSHNSYLRGDLQVEINSCAACQEYVGFYAFEELLKEKLIQFRLELLNPNATSVNFLFF